MTKFYVKITDELPSVDEKALWFEIDSENENSKEFFVLGRNEYNTMHDEFVQAKDNLENSEVLSDAIDTLMNNESFRVPLATLASRSESADKLINPADPNNQEQKFTWSSLTARFNSVASAIADKVSSEQLTSVVNSLTSSINGKANATHPHKRWIRVDASAYGSVYYNADLQMCFFRYYRGDNAQYNIKKTWTSYNIYSMGDSKYFPIKNTHLQLFNPHQYGFMDTDGKLYIGNVTSTGNQNVNISGFWLCKGATTS